MKNCLSQKKKKKLNAPNYLKYIEKSNIKRGKNGSNGYAWKLDIKISKSSQIV